MIGTLREAMPPPEGRDGTTCPLIDLQSPDNPVGIMGVQVLSNDRIHFSEELIEPSSPSALGLGLQSRSNNRIHLPALDQPRGQGPDVEARAPHHHRPLSPRLHLGNGLPGLFAEKGGAELLIRVEDINKIFQPFYSTKEKGTGMGLAICRRIVEEHNGELTVESREGRGASFSLILPLDQITPES
mgnify:CR=1 FL=1